MKKYYLLITFSIVFLNLIIKNHYPFNLYSMFSMHKTYDYQFFLLDGFGKRVSFVEKTGIKANSIRKRFLRRLNKRDFFKVTKTHSLWQLSEHRNFLREQNKVNVEIIQEQKYRGFLRDLIRKDFDIDLIERSGFDVKIEIFKLENKNVFRKIIDV